MKHVLTFTSGLTALLMVLPAGAQQHDPAFRAAYDAWPAGRYPDAIARLDAILNAAPPDRTVAAIALLTGELYRVTEVDVDGTAPRWSGDGRYVAFATPSGRATAAVRRPPDDPARERVTVTEAEARLEGESEGWVVRVKAENRQGLVSWDWARERIGDW